MLYILLTDAAKIELAEEEAQDEGVARKKVTEEDPVAGRFQDLRMSAHEETAVRRSFYMRSPCHLLSKPFSFSFRV